MFGAFQLRFIALVAKLSAAAILAATFVSTAIAGDVDTARLLNAANNNAEWVTHGRTYDEQRFSPLKKVNQDNVKTLGLAWYFDLDTSRGQESTPLIVDGTMYFTSAWSKVFAVDARTGKEKWRFDPKVAGEKNGDACCDVVNRGVAAWGKNVFVGTLDGRLIALDMATGKERWSVQTSDPDKRYTITGTPRVIKGKVIVGNAGAEMNVRGYVSAYDSATGKMLWRFYTVPGNPRDGFENAAMERAAKTWTGEWWKLGGGGTVWDSMAYDPQLDLLYIGTGNGTPWNRKIRSPDGGDNLYIASILALKPDTGDYVWHYQTTPGESWDFDATQHMILADLTIDNKPRKVLMQACKNGFFYVLDRKSGKLISANNYVNVSWATGLDADGRPKFAPEAFYVTEPAQVAPGPIGGHNWYPTSFSPLTQLVYIPATESSSYFAQDANFKDNPRGWNTGTLFFSTDKPSQQTLNAANRSLAGAMLIAWNPVTQREAWRVPYATRGNGAVLSTAGNLVFQGSADGYLNAYRADTGVKLWSYAAQNGVVAAPVTYELDGEQYVAVEAGVGGVMSGGTSAGVAPPPRSEFGRLLVFKLGATASLPAIESKLTAREIPDLTNANVSGDVNQGHAMYDRTCAGCHGVGAVSATAMPDLRYSPSIVDRAGFKAIVIDGARKDKGMVSFASMLKSEEAEAIRAYLVSQAAVVKAGATR